MQTQARGLQPPGQGKVHLTPSSLSVFGFCRVKLLRSFHSGHRRFELGWGSSSGETGPCAIGIALLRLHLFCILRSPQRRHYEHKAGVFTTSTRERKRLATSTTTRLPCTAEFGRADAFQERHEAGHTLLCSSAMIELAKEAWLLQIWC